jgi:DNA-binding NarL/FixJ family response regulator
MRKRVLIADDHELMLVGIEDLLRSQFEVVGKSNNGRDLVEDAKRLRPDIVVLDVGMPQLNGIEAARQISSMLPRTQIVFLTQQLDPNYVQAGFRAGARGYVAKQAAATELLEAIRIASQNCYFVTPLAQTNAPDRLAIRSMRTNPADFFGASLTPRQREVLQLVAEGKSSKEIASTLGISVKTVEFHRASLMDQLGLRSTAELTRYAVSAGIVTG